MISHAIQKPRVKLNNNHSMLKVTLSDKIDKYQTRSLLERLDYLGVNADILAYSENEDSLSIKIGSVDLFTVKRCKKVVETLFSCATVSIENIGGISYREYVYEIGA